MNDFTKEELEDIWGRDQKCDVLMTINKSLLHRIESLVTGVEFDLEEPLLDE